MKNTVQFLLSAVLMPIIALVQRYIFADWEFMKFLLVLVAIDTMLSLYRHYHSNSINSKRFAIIIPKLIGYLLLLILSHVIVHFTVEGEQNSLFAWFQTFCYSAIIVREALSILEHFSLLFPSIVPKTILKRLRTIEKGGFADIDAPWNKGTDSDYSGLSSETITENVPETPKTAAETGQNNKYVTGTAEGGLL
jgi:phage-related holin